MAGNTSDYGMMFDDEEDDLLELRQAVISEVDRIQRMDQWLPSFQNVLSLTALQIKRELVLTKIMESDLTEFLAYTREGTSDTLRLKAFECLVDLGALRNRAILHYICNVIGTDPSPYIRRAVLMTFIRGLGAIAYGLESKVKSQFVVDDVVLQDAIVRHAETSQGTIASALITFRSELGKSESFKSAIWIAAT